MQKLQPFCNLLFALFSLQGFHRSIFRDFLFGLLHHAPGSSRLILSMLLYDFVIVLFGLLVFAGLIFFNFVPACIFS